MAEADLLHIIGLIYDAALDHAQWEDALNATSAFLHAEGASLAVDRRQSLYSLNTGYGEQALEGYGGHWHDINPLWPGACTATAGTVLIDREAVARQAYLGSEFFNDFVRPRGILANMSIKVLEQVEMSVVVALHRCDGAGAREFGTEDASRAALLAPHFARAMAMSDRLARAQDAAASIKDGLDLLSEATLIVDVRGHVLFANRSARAMLDTSDGLKVDANGLRALTQAATDRLHYRIATANDSQSCGDLTTSVALPRSSGRRSLLAFVAAAPKATPWAALHHARAAAIIFVRDPDAGPKISAEELRQQYGLTPAEASLTLAVAQGLGLKTTADRLGVSLATAKTHLQRVFEKTGTRRQAELLRLVFAS